MWLFYITLVIILILVIFYKIKFKKIISEIDNAKCNIYLCDQKINNIQNQMTLFQESITKISNEIAEIENTVKSKRKKNA